MIRRWGAPILIAAVSFAAGGWVMGPRAAAPRSPEAERFARIATTVAANYVDSVAQDTLYAVASRALVDSLHDPYAQLLVADALREFNAQLTGAPVNPGTQASPPADGAGVGTPAVSAGMPAREGAALTRLFRPTVIPAAPRNAPAGRNPGATRARMLGRGVGYVELASITERSPAELRATIETLRARGMRSLVLDLRGNPGGLIEQGVEIAELFLEPGDTVADVRGRGPRRSRTYVDRLPQPWPQLPLAILVDRGTASAAEIIAAALQEHRRAALIGTPTYGKGVVQTTFTLAPEVAIKLTTARWYTPGGRMVQRHDPLGGSGGLTPDLTVRPRRHDAVRAPADPAAAPSATPLANRPLTHALLDRLGTPGAAPRQRIQSDRALARAAALLRGARSPQDVIERLPAGHD